jgi:hypothetical protein
MRKAKLKKRQASAHSGRTPTFHFGGKFKCGTFLHNCKRAIYLIFWEKCQHRLRKNVESVKTVWTVNTVTTVETVETVLTLGSLRWLGPLGSLER